MTGHRQGDQGAPLPTGGPPKADELIERHRPRASLYPESIRRLAVAMVEHAVSDLERPRWIRGAGRYVPADYRPDPEGAIAWLHRATDAPLSARWCEQITGVCLDPLRKRYPLRTDMPRERTASAQERRTRRGRPETPARPNDAALREYGLGIIDMSPGTAFPVPLRLGRLFP